jgi:tryptophan halogenase
MTSLEDDANRTGKQVRRIVILGGGTSGWMCAAAFSQLLRAPGYSVRLIESDEIGTVGVGEATLPHIKAFNDQLGVNEAAFMRATQATFKLGIEFRGWGATGSYVHPFGAFGQDWAGVEFHHYWRRAKAAGITVGPLEDYCIAIAAARAHRFDFPTEDANSVRSQYAYAYHFDAALYARFMRDFATGRGVRRTEGRVVDVRLEPESGDIASLKLQSGEVVEGDLFIDCSGFAELLIEKALKVGWEDWTDWLPCDRAWAVASMRSPDFAPYTRLTAREAGWQWRIPLQHRTGNGYVFSSAFINEDRAAETLLANLDGPALADPKLLRFKAGRRRESWRRNCVAIGLASGFLEPLESTSIYLVQAAITQVLKLLSVGPVDDRLRREFNHAIDLEYQRVRDFLILHYHANIREGEPLWDYTRVMEVPDSLKHSLELFRRRGYVQPYKDGLFSPPSWIAVFNGQGISPLGHDRMAEVAPLDLVVEKLAELRERVAHAVAAMPDHAATVGLYCRAAEREMAQ